MNIERIRYLFLLRTFTDGGNFSRDEIELYRKKLDNSLVKIEHIESNMLKQMQRLEKKQLDEATKIMKQFQDRYETNDCM
jgi:hypothetical protein